MRFFLLCFVIYFKKYINNNSYLLSTFSNNNYRSIYTGNDERYPINETNNEAEMYNIYKNHENKKLLDILENDKISINTKLNLLTPNITEDELEIIKKYHRNDCTILIDDLRCIKNAIGWGMSVEFDSLIEKLKEINPDYHFEYEDGQDGHQNDILVAYIKN